MFERIQEHPIVRRAMRVNERYGEDAGGYLAASIAYYAFLSVFPLLLLGLSVVGFLLNGSPEFQEDVREALAGSVPGVGDLVGRNIAALQDARTSAGVIGLAGLLWTGTGVVGAGRNTLRRVFRQGTRERGWRQKAWLVGVTVGLGLLAITATALSALAGGFEAEGLLGGLVKILGVTVAFAMDVALFLVAYRVLMGEPKRWIELVPGAVFAGVGWTALKLLGTWYATSTVQGSESVYGTFAAAVGVLVLLYLAARVFVYGAELNAVLHEEKGGGPVGDAQWRSERAPNGDAREKSTIKLVGQVAGDVGALVKKEVELARQEITEAVMARLKAIGAFLAIGVIALFIVQFLGLAAAAGLANVLPVWAALLIVAGVFILFAVLAALFGMRRLQSPPLAPEQTKKTIKEDVEWAKAQLRR